MLNAPFSIVVASIIDPQHIKVDSYPQKRNSVDMYFE